MAISVAQDEALVQADVQDFQRVHDRTAVGSTPLVGRGVHTTAATYPRQPRETDQGRVEHGRKRLHPAHPRRPRSLLLLPTGPYRQAPRSGSETVKSEHDAVAVVVGGQREGYLQDEEAESEYRVCAEPGDEAWRDDDGGDCDCVEDGVDAVVAVAFDGAVDAV